MNWEEWKTRYSFICLTIFLLHLLFHTSLSGSIKINYLCSSFHFYYIYNIVSALCKRKEQLNLLKLHILLTLISSRLQQDLIKLTLYNELEIIGGVFTWYHFPTCSVKMFNVTCVFYLTWWMKELLLTRRSNLSILGIEFIWIDLHLASHERNYINYSFTLSSFN